MTGSHHSTNRPFCLVLCTSCHSQLGTAVLEQLRATVRRTRQGVLVTAGCLLGDSTCLARQNGAVVVLQPCSSDRTSHGPATLIGQIESLDDLRIVSEWVERGRWESEDLPDRLCLAPPTTRRSIATN